VSIEAYYADLAVNNCTLRWYAADLCQCKTYYHPYTGKPSSWIQFLSACFLPACFLGEIETLMEEEPVQSQPWCGAQLGDRGAKQARCACCAMGICCLPVVSIMACKQRQRLVEQYGIRDPHSGCLQSTVATICCLGCALLQAERFLDERKCEKCGSFFFLHARKVVYARLSVIPDYSSVALVSPCSTTVRDSSSLRFDAACGIRQSVWACVAFVCKVTSH
jgi:hypothetical protein